MRVAIAILTVLCVLGTTESSHAGEYQVWSCADTTRLVYDDSYTFRLAAAWRSSGDRHYLPAASCSGTSPSTEHRFGLTPLPEAGAVPGASEMAFAFTPPAGADIKRFKVWTDMRITTSGMEAGFRTNSGAHSCFAPCTFGFGDYATAPGNPFAERRVVQESPITGRRLEMFLRCATTEPCTPAVWTATDYLLAYAVLITMEAHARPS